MSFELEDERAVKPCGGFCRLVQIVANVLIITVGWVVVGVIAKLCARLFFLGWDLI